MPGAANGYFLVEVDGISIIEASEAEIGSPKHEPYKIGVGNRPNQYLGRGKYEVEEFKLKNAYALNREGEELFEYFRRYIRGLTVEKVNIRVVQMEENGLTPYRVHEMIECVPTTYKPEGKKGDSKDAAYFEMAFMPTDYDEYSA